MTSLFLWRLLGNVVEDLPDAVVAYDDDGVVHWSNPAARRLFATVAGDRWGSSMADLLGDGWADQMAGLVHAHERRRAMRGEVLAHRRDGTTFPLELAVASVQAVPGLHTFVGRSIAGRKAAEAELAALRRRHELVLHSAGEGICGIDAAGNIVFANPALASMLGVDESDLVGRNFHDAAHGCGPGGAPDHGWPECPVRTTLADQIPQSVFRQLHWSARAGAFPAAYFSAPVRDHADVVRAVVSVADVSERQRIEQMKDEFLAVAGHELRTPLTSISASLRLVAEGVTGEVPESMRPMLDIAVANADRLVRIVSDLLDAERLSRGEDVLRTTPVAAHELVTAALRATEAAANETGVAIDARAGDAVVRADPDRAVQALVNLIANAVKFSPPGATVRVTAQDDGSQVLIRVADAGPGIDPSDHERIFERFAQVESPDHRRTGGSGLGLAIARDIARAHGGDILVRSALGRGSDFALALPAVRPPGPLATTGSLA